MNTVNITKNNAGAIVDALTEALGANTVIDALMLTMTTEQLTEFIRGSWTGVAVVAVAGFTYWMEWAYTACSFFVVFPALQLLVLFF